MRQNETPGYRHEALFYQGDEEFLAGTLPLVREAVDAEAAVLVAIPTPRAAALRGALDGHRDGIAFADMEELGRNPGRIIAAWRDFVRASTGGDVLPLGIGEPIWPERSEAELVERQRHEILLNLAFTAETPWTLLCSYDARRLPHDVLAGRDCPPPTELGGRGLFLVNQLCDLVQLRSSPEGSVIRLHMHLA